VSECPVALGVGMMVSVRFGSGAHYGRARFYIAIIAFGYRESRNE